MVSPSSQLSTVSIVDQDQARWAAWELSHLIARVGEESVAGMVLRNARQELSSLVGDMPTSTRTQDESPVRIRTAA